MKHKLAKLVTDVSADYADIRHEENRKIRIIYKGKRLEQITASTTSGGNLRAYAGGGRSIASFSDPGAAASIARTAVASARLVGASRDKPLRIVQAPVIVGSFLVVPTEDPRTIPLEEKLALTTHYNDLILGEADVITSTTAYDEFYSRRIFVNSDGSIVEYDLLNVGIAGLVATKRGNVVQRVRIAFGGNEDFGRLRGREDDLKQQIVKAQELLDAEPAKAGTFPVILDQSEASVFIHEAFGHLSEADGLQNNPAFRERLKLGTTLAKPLLSVTDDPTVPGHPGSYEIDDEGVRGVRTPLITEGVLTGRLHSRETAAEFGEPLSGNMRAVDIQFTPIVRMSNISIEPGASTFDEMVASIDNGYYLVGAKGGQTSGDQFTFGAQWGYRIENGRLGPLVRDINMSGELFSTLQAISMIGNDRKFGERGGCGKGGGGPMQLNRKSGSGAPHIKIDRVTVGGVG
ncbi:TldD/PmbA family protein [Candidatus Bipolaricaulota bacterium]|nr:TldD/PmbA family protein [Candidatus Bipolaricaulota bacterium]